MIGIGVGIDYALFISTRYREALHEGADPEHVGRARDRHERARGAVRGRHGRDLAARAVPDRRVVHPGTGGRRVARGPVRDGRRGDAAPRGARLRRLHDRQVGASGARAGARRSSSSFWARWSRTLQARPVARGDRRRSRSSSSSRSRSSRLRLGVADAGNDPTKFTTRRAYDLLSQGFGPGFNGPLLVASDVRSPRRHRRDERACGTTIADDPGRRSRSARPITSPNGKGVLLQVVAEGLAPGREHDRSSSTACATTSCPTRPRAPALDVHVGGQTAVGVDLADTARAAPAVHVPGDPVAQLRAADARVPLAARAAQGRDHEPALDRRGVRRDRRDLPVGLGQEPRSASARKARSRRGCR